MKIKIISLVPLLMMFASLSAQTKLSQYGRYDSISVTGTQDSLINPWVGGLNNLSMCEIDLNQDLYTDLLVFDKDHYSIRVYLQDWNGGKPFWKHHPEYESKIPRINNWVVGRDYNFDGKVDLFTSRGRSNGDLYLYKNTSTGGNPEDVSFELVPFPDLYDSTKTVNFISCRLKSGSKYTQTNVYNLPTDIPGIVDIDADGDIDILSFGVASSSLFLYKNMSRETFGKGDSMYLELVDLCWGSFGEASNVFFLDTAGCNSNLPGRNPKNNTPRGSSRHEGSTMLFEDFDCNGLPDIILGDVSFSKAVVGYNHGNLTKGHITNQDTLYPSFDVPINVDYFPGLFYIDYNFDGEKDLIAAPNAEAHFKDYNQIHVYKNSKTSSCPDLAFEKEDFLVDNMIDLGTNAYPLLVDVNGDSLLDIISGSFGSLTRSNSHESRISYFENVGSKTYPIYAHKTRDYLPLPFSQDSGLYPTVGDLDGDGDLDLLLGSFSGNIYYYQNNAQNPGDSVEWTLTPTSFDTVDFGKSIRPYLFDIDNDGLLDLLVGSQLSYIKYYKNTGNQSVPNFSNSSVIHNWGGIDIRDALSEGNLSIYIADLDTNGKLIDTVSNITSERHVFIGTSTGNIELYLGIDSTGQNTLTKEDELYVYTQNVALNMDDMTGDGKLDMIFGQKSGGMSILLRDGGNIILPPKPEPVDTTSLVENTSHENKFKIFPNPAQNEVHIASQQDFDSKIHISLFNINGGLVIEQEFVNETTLAIDELNPGIYFMVLLTEKGKFNFKLVKTDK
jgi:hypothetical protein